jgi:hypothetical protein
MPTMTDKEPLSISAGQKFWRTVTAEEFSEICDNGGYLTGVLAERMWRMCDMQGPCPPRLEVLIHKPSLDKLLRKLRKEKRHGKARAVKQA